MLSRNGGRLASNCLPHRSGTVAARGFFDVFWRWSTVSCPAPNRVVTASYRTRATSSLNPFPRSQRFGKPLPRFSSPFSSHDPTPEPASEEDNDLPNTVRLLMRSLPHSVVVVTSNKSPNSHNEPNPDSYRGMTVSSFTTITLEPDPIISFNVKVPSETFTAIQKSKAFLLHILEANERGARIADAFTKGSQSVARLLQGGEKGVVVSDVRSDEGEGDISLPMLEAKGVRKVLWCELVDEVEVADHVVVIAEVMWVLDDEEIEREGNGGLCYADGRYRRVGDVIDAWKIGDVVEVDEDAGEEKDGRSEVDEDGGENKVGRREVMRKIA